MRISDALFMTGISEGGGVIVGYAGVVGRGEKGSVKQERGIQEKRTQIQ